jgi:hypothetical protein
MRTTGWNCSLGLCECTLSTFTVCIPIGCRSTLVFLKTSTKCLLVLATVQNCRIGSRPSTDPDLNHCNWSYDIETHHSNITRLPPIQYWSSDRIVTWSICTLCSVMRTHTSRCQICNPSNIRSVAIGHMWILLQILPCFTVIQRTLVR